METILVTGGAGYIGSHTCHMLIEEGYNVIVFDNLEKGHKKALPSKAKLYVGDLRNYDEINNVFKENKIDAVVHFAAYIDAAESVKEPLKYYQNNVANGLNLLNAMKENDVKKLVFSSSAAVYGNTDKVPVKEETEKIPANPYGFSKLMFEEILESCNNIQSVCLRYFNPVGCGYGIGRDYKPVTALVPIILQVAQGKRDNIEIFGIDYKTKDGTPVRDFVHVLDLAKAHILALQYQKEKQTNIILNVATGKGQSVKEVIKIVEEVTGKDIPTIESPRREGDIGISMASAERLEKEFGWKPTKSIREMIVSDWEWLNKK